MLGFLGFPAVLAALAATAAAGAPLAYLGAWVFDPVSLSVTGSIPLRIQAVHPSGTLAYGFVVPPAGSPAPAAAMLGALDTRTNTVVATLPVPFEPAGLALDPAGTQLYVTGRTLRESGLPPAAPGTVLVIDAVTLAVRARIDLAPAIATSAPLLHPSGVALYVFRDTTVDVIDTASHRVVSSIPVSTSGDQFTAFFIHPSGNFIYASTRSFLLFGPSSAVVIDTRINAVLRTLSLRNNLDRLGAILPRGSDNALLLTTGLLLGPALPTGDVFDAATGQQVATLPLPGIPLTAVTHPDGRAVYFSFLTCLIPSCNVQSAGVAIVDGRTLGLIADIPAAKRPSPGDLPGPGQVPPPVLSLDAARGVLYARGASLQTIGLETNALIADVPFAEEPSGRVEQFAFGPEREPAPGRLTFYTLGSAGDATSAAWGEPGDRPVPADYDGDGRTDVAVWRPRHGAVEGVWFVLRSSDGAGTGQQWGAAAYWDRPVPADYDGDGRADLAVWRPVEGSPLIGVTQGIWYIVRSADGVGISQQWGASGDLPVPADYDGDGRADLAVWRPSTGQWWIVSSRDGALTGRGWGASGDLPVPADYDGDGRADVAVWRSSTGEWWIVASRNGAVIRRPWGAPGDQPLPTDVDGDRRSDLTIYRP